MVVVFFFFWGGAGFILVKCETVSVSSHQRTQRVQQTRLFLNYCLEYTSFFFLNYGRIFSKKHLLTLVLLKFDSTCPPVGIDVDAFVF